MLLIPLLALLLLLKLLLSFEVVTIASAFDVVVVDVVSSGIVLVFAAALDVVGAATVYAVMIVVDVAGASFGIVVVAVLQPVKILRS